MVGSESGQWYSDVVGVGGCVESQLEIEVPKTHSLVVIAGVCKRTVATFECKASSLTMGGDGEQVGEDFELVGGEAETSVVQSESSRVLHETERLFIVQD